MSWRYENTCVRRCLLFFYVSFSQLLSQTDVPTRSPTFPAAQSVQVEEDVAPMAGLDFPRPHFAHSLSASVSFRVWLRYVPAGQLAHGFAAPLNVLPS